MDSFRGAANMKRNKNMIIILFSLVIVLVGLIGWNQYTKSNTTYVYGKVPQESVPDEYDTISYTIPVIDKEGQRSTQTFEVDTDEEIGRIVKLSIFNEKVKKHEFISEEELPKTIQNNL